MKSDSQKEVDDESELIARINQSESSKDFVSTRLRTDEQVIARVTDGIYRQPASSLREMISNSYDADATRVVIKTDAPRFDRISIEDNGHGMTPEVLAHLLFHIGGSAKRTATGSNLGVTEKSDPTRSPKGRKLIGKIGIGLFSVSQLTHSFQIITKIKGASYRTIATVALKQYADNDQADHPDLPKEFESGKVNIWREPAADVSSHGTTIVLTNIRPQAKDTLRSRDVWSAIEQSEEIIEEGAEVLEPPKFHIGRVDSTGKLLRKTAGNYMSLPWEEGDSPEKAFKKLVQSVWDEVEESNPNPQLERVFDYYLRMVWQLSLSIPLPYIDKHLFDMPVSGWATTFKLSNRPKGAAELIEAPAKSLIRQSVQLSDPVDEAGRFDVYFDDLKLSRPIKFADLPVTGHALKTPLVFVGKCNEKFANVPRELSGGPLDFEAYLFWNPKIAPTEHRGSLIRIHGSSGTLFDSTFMRYQIAELTRLSQITCEIFVSQGLESSLNIDRESFNNAHPHSVYITRWLHSALRQVATAQKKLASEARKDTRAKSEDSTVSQIQQIAQDVWIKEMDDPDSPPPEIQLSDSGKKSKGAADAYVYARSAVVPRNSTSKSPKGQSRDKILEEKLKAIAQVLASYGLLDKLSKRKQEQLLNAVYKIIETIEE